MYAIDNVVCERVEGGGESEGINLVGSLGKIYN